MNNFSIWKNYSYKTYPKNESVAKYYGRFLLNEYLDGEVIGEINKILGIVENGDLFVTEDKKFRIAILRVIIRFF